MRRFGSIKAMVVEWNEGGGAWMIETSEGDILRVIASIDDGWDHVSVSLVDRMPTWDEMELVKRTFFKTSETAVQFHVPPNEHINIHPYCLHLWRPQRVKIPLPPKWMV